MLFTSYPFIGFLAAVLVLYYVIPRKWQWPLLLIASCAFLWAADPRYLLFILVTTATAYVSALQMTKLNLRQKDYLREHKAQISSEEKNAYKTRMRHKKQVWLLGFLLLNLGILSVTKYTNFVLENLHNLFGSGPFRAIDLIIPMGISYYTFQTVSYIIDTYRDTVQAQRNPFKLALFVCFFPLMVQGPISRYGQLSETLYAGHAYDGKNISFGLMRILWGYFKKVVIADRIIIGVKALIQAPESYGGAFVFVAMIFYAFELYCDFTGGIDITIGIAEMFGIRLAENFNLPFFSKNIKEYWNRWHITMGTWFTDYIFYPISISSPFRKLSKWSRKHLGKGVGKRVPVYLSSFAVWLATGVWHGAAWNFIVWGLANYVVIMVSQEFEPLYARFHKRFPAADKGAYGVFQILRTFLLMSAIRMFDCYRNVPLTFKMLGSMVTRFRFSVFTDGSLLSIGLSGADYLVLAVGLLVLLGVGIYKAKKGSVRQALYKRPVAVFYCAMAVLFLVIMVFGAYGIGFDSSQFIYNQF